MSFKDEMAKVRKALEGMTTDSNVESMANLSKNLDEVEREHEKTTKDLNETKSTLVKYVKEYAFKSPSEDFKPEEDSAPKSLDDAMKMALDDIDKKREKEKK